MKGGKEKKIKYKKQNLCLTVKDNGIQHKDRPKCYNVTNSAPRFPGTSNVWLKGLLLGDVAQIPVISFLNESSSTFSASDSPLKSRRYRSKKEQADIFKGSKTLKIKFPFGITGQTGLTLRSCVQCASYVANPPAVNGEKGQDSEESSTKEGEVNSLLNGIFHNLKDPFPQHIGETKVLHCNGQITRHNGSLTQQNIAVFFMRAGERWYINIHRLACQFASFFLPLTCLVCHIH